MNSRTLITMAIGPGLVSINYPQILLDVCVSSVASEASKHVHTIFVILAFTAGVQIHGHLTQQLNSMCKL